MKTFTGVVLASFAIAFTPAGASDVSTLYLSDQEVAKVLVSTRGTVLSFPTKPSKVLLGNSGVFGVEYVERDVAVTPLTAGARANLFVYMLGKRFTFELTAATAGANAVVLVRDTIERPTLVTRATELPVKSEALPESARKNAKPK